MLRIKQVSLLFIAWMAASVAAYFIAAFLAASHAKDFQSLAITFLVITVLGAVGYVALQSVGPFMQAGQWRVNWPLLAAILLLGRFAYKIVEVSLSFPNLFQAPGFLLPPDSLPPFFLASFFAFGGAWLLVRQPGYGPKIGFLRFASAVRDQSPGLLLAGIFFVVYFVLANVFNRLDFNNNNVFFAADTHQWQLRLVAADASGMEMRAIHPLAFIILRPLVFTLSFLFDTDRFHATILLLALVGSAGVFLAWVFLKRAVGEEIHAFLFTALLGISTTHLMFSSIIETYIFSSFLLILFFVLLQNRSSLFWLVISGAAIFGITISNLVQTLIGLFLSNLRIRQTAIYVLLIIAIGVVFSFVNRAFYPDSGFFFNPADYGAESQHYVDDINVTKSVERARLVSTDMFLFSIVAPQPFLQIYHKDERGEFPKFNFMQGDRLSKFVGLGRIAIWIWIGILGTAAFGFARSIRQEGFSASNRLILVFLSCLGFNFVFHFVYGFEPFLYAVNWTYALVFFTALASRPFARSKWTQTALLILLALLTLNNLSFLYFLMDGFAPFIPQI